MSIGSSVSLSRFGFNFLWQSVTWGFWFLLHSINGSMVVIYRCFVVGWKGKEEAPSEEHGVTRAISGKGILE